MEKSSVTEELIVILPPGGNSCTKSVNQLKYRFGQVELLIEHYVRGFLCLVLQRQNLGTAEAKHN